MLNLYKEKLFVFKLLFMQQVLSFPIQNDSQSLYDQRQTGKYNIHISLKDVAIIEIDKNEFVDDTLSNSDEYYYDEDDLTIKPISTWSISTTITAPPLINTSTKRPINSHATSKPNENNPESQQEIHAANIDAMNTSFMLDKHSSLPSVSVHSPMVSDTDMVLKPVLHKPKINTDDNIPQLRIAQRSRQHIISDTQVGSDFLESKQNKKSAILKIISTRPLSHRQINICRSNFIVDTNGNCRKKRQPSVLKSLFGILKLLRIKDM